MTRSPLTFSHSDAIICLRGRYSALLCAPSSLYRGVFFSFHSCLTSNSFVIRGFCKRTEAVLHSLLLLSSFLPCARAVRLWFLPHLEHCRLLLSAYFSSNNIPYSLLPFAAAYDRCRTVVGSAHSSGLLIKRRPGDDRKDTRGRAICTSTERDPSCAAAWQRPSHKQDRLGTVIQKD